MEGSIAASESHLQSFPCVVSVQQFVAVMAVKIRYVMESQKRLIYFLAVFLLMICCNMFDFCSISVFCQLTTF